MEMRWTGTWDNGTVRCARLGDGKSSAPEYRRDRREICLRSRHRKTQDGKLGNSFRGFLGLMSRLNRMGVGCRILLHGPGSQV